VHRNPPFAFQIKMFFLRCAIVAGAFSATMSTRALPVQAFRAAVALIVLHFA
jgi:putative membrane protein